MRAGLRAGRGAATAHLLRDKLERDWEAQGKLERYREAMRAAEAEHFLKRWWRFRRVHRRFGWKFWAFISGGAMLDPETEAFWHRLGFAVIQGYGLTENASLISVSHPFRLSQGSIGKVMPGREVRLDAALDATGEILVRGETSRWAIASAGTRGRFRKRMVGSTPAIWVSSMRAATCISREKNAIVTPEAQNVYPEDLEAALRRQPEVRDCTVVGLARDGNAEPCAVLLLRDDVGQPEEIVQRANQLLAAYQQVRWWLLWPAPDLPRTSTGKPPTSLIQQVVQARQQVVQARLGGQPTETLAVAPQAAARAGEVRTAGRDFEYLGTQAADAAGGLADLVSRLTGRTPVALSPDASLEADLNLSSVERVELLSAIEDLYQVELNESKFTAATTVGQLEQMICHEPASLSGYSFPRWAQRWPAMWIRLAAYYALIWPATLLLGHPRTRGRENLRSLRPPVLVVANHIDRVDIALILAALPARFRHRLAAAMDGERLRALRQPPREVGFLRRWLDRTAYALLVPLLNASLCRGKADTARASSLPASWPIAATAC